MVKLQPEEREFLLMLRKMPADSQKGLRKSYFATLHQRYGIPREVKLTVDIDNADDPHYCVLKDKSINWPWGEPLPAPPADVAPLDMSGQARQAADVESLVGVSADMYALLKMLQDSEYVMHTSATSNAITIGFRSKVVAHEACEMIGRLRATKD